MGEPQSSSRPSGMDSSLSASHVLQALRIRLCWQMAPLRIPCTGSLPERAGRCSPLRTPCIGTLSERAGRCSPLRNPCTCSFSGGARRCPPLRTPCICSSFADCAHIAPASPLVLAFPPRCSLPRHGLAAASCCLLLSAPPRLRCCLHHLSAPTCHPCFLLRCFSRRCAPCLPLLDQSPHDPCLYRRRQRHQLPKSWPHLRPQPLPTQAD